MTKDKIINDLLKALKEINTQLLKTGVCDRQIVQRAIDKAKQT